MKKALRIVAITTGIISALSAVILGFIYLEDIVSQISNLKSKITSRINERKYIGVDHDED